MTDISRRNFLTSTAAGAAVAATGTAAAQKSANETIRVAVLGINGRGKSHLDGFQNLPNVEVVTLCDPDSSLFAPRIKEFFTDKGLKEPKTETDMRRVMDDPDIDVVSIATPNHWHTLAGLWAVQAGKDAYVEKPGTHNVFEGRKMLEAIEKYDRIVQHGTQIRSQAAIIEAIQHIRDGLLGEVYMARGLCYRWRPSIGTGVAMDPPANLDWNLWQGPAQERQYMDYPDKKGSKGIYVHYNWHYTWEYGNGDIGNQGVHQLDLARWGLDVQWPTRVTSASGMFIFDDAKEVPNVITTTYDYPDAGERGKMLTFDVRPWMTNDEQGARVGVLFYGSEGYMVIDTYSRYKTFLGEKGEPGPSNDAGGDHYGNFIEAVRKHDRSILNAEFTEAHYSSGLAHLGLASAKLNRSLEFDPKTEQFIDDAEANACITREYRDPFVVPETV